MLFSDRNKNGLFIIFNNVRDDIIPHYESMNWVVRETRSESIILSQTSFPTTATQ
jgi:hypothetical protein